MKAYPVELRSRIVPAVERGMPRAEVAALFAVSVRTIARDVAQQRQGHELTPARPPASHRTGAGRHAGGPGAAHPDATLAAPCAIWEQEQGVRVSVATMSRALQARAITLKKSAVRCRAR